MSLELIMGNEAVALGALRAGVNVVCGYPGTPSSEVLESASARVRAWAGSGAVEPALLPHIEWSTNEKAALEVAAGAAFAGGRALMTCKQVGLNVASDPLMTLAYLGLRGGLVLLVADDPGPISSQTEQDTRLFAAFAKVPVFDPSSPQEAFTMVQEAFELSEKYGCPVIVRSTTRVAHSSAAIDTGFEYVPHAAAGFERSPRWVIFPQRAYEAHLEVWQRLEAVERDFDAYEGNVIGGGAARRGVVANGISWAYLQDALDDASLRLFKVATPFPFPEERALEFLQGLDEVLVFEELEPVIEQELLRIVGKHHLPVVIKGKLTGHTNRAGENSVNVIAEQLTAWLDVADGRAVKTAPTANNPTPPTLPTRPPALCAGCPHRGSFAAVKKALGKRKAVLCGDIGCYTLANAAPLDAVDTCVCMGAGFTVPQGMYWVEPDVKHVGFVGDSTFFASGITGVANAVYNRADVTFFVLDNATTAMTGTQPHPGTGIRMSYDASPQDAANAISIEAVLRAMGVAHVVVAEPLNHRGSIAAASTAIDHAGVSAVIFRSPCINVTKPGPMLQVIADKCTLCRRCINTFGCPALVVRDRAVAIDESLCFGCKLCAQACPTYAIVRKDDAV